MKAFVLSGGSTLGPTQVGAMRVLLAEGIKPDLIVGVSAGALNAAFLAQEVSIDQLDRLAEVWRRVTREDVYPNNHLEVGWRLCAGADSLYDNQRFFQFLQRQGVGATQTFGERCAVPLCVTATHLHSGRMRIFGSDPADTVLDALMASTALPPLHAPWVVQGERYVDGGLVTPLPLRVALARGATEIYALYVSEDTSHYGTEHQVSGVPAVLVRSISTTMEHAAKVDRILAAQTPGVRVHEIQLHVPQAPAVIDFSHADRLIEFGRAQATAYLQRTRVRHRPARTVNNRWTPRRTGEGIPALDNRR